MFPFNLMILFQKVISGQFGVSFLTFIAFNPRDFSELQELTRIEGEIVLQKRRH